MKKPSVKGGFFFIFAVPFYSPDYEKVPDSTRIACNIASDIYILLQTGKTAIPRGAFNGCFPLGLPRQHSYTQPG